MSKPKNIIWCPEREQQRATVLCPRCEDFEYCAARREYEYKLRRERSAYMLSLWGKQRRLIPDESMDVDKSET